MRTDQLLKRALGIGPVGNYPYKNELISPETPDLVREVKARRMVKTCGVGHPVWRVTMVGLAYLGVNLRMPPLKVAHGDGCLNCKGAGKVYKFLAVSGQACPLFEFEICQSCGGTGRRKNEI